MSGVGMIEGTKKITQKMIDRQRLIAETENNRLDLMINLFNQAGHGSEDSFLKENQNLTRPEAAEPADLSGSLEYTSPRQTDNSGRRLNSMRGIPKARSPRDIRRHRPTINPTDNPLNLTTNPNRGARADREPAALLPEETK